MPIFFAVISAILLCTEPHFLGTSVPGAPHTPITERPATLRDTLAADGRAADGRDADVLAADGGVAYYRAADGRAADGRAAGGGVAYYRAADGSAANGWDGDVVAADGGVGDVVAADGGVAYYRAADGRAATAEKADTLSAAYRAANGRATDGVDADVLAADGRAAIAEKADTLTAAYRASEGLATDGVDADDRAADGGVAYYRAADGRAAIAEKADTLTAAYRAAKRNDPTQSAVPVRAMDSATMQRLGRATVDEALLTFTGVAVRDYGGIGGMKTVSVRAMGAQHTAVFYDSIQLSDLQSGQVDLSINNFVKPLNIKVSISGNEDIMSNASKNLASGVLEMETTPPSLDNRSSRVIFQGRYGSFRTWNPHLLWEQRLGQKLKMTVNLDYLNSRGDYPFTTDNGIASETLRRAGSDVSRGRAEVGLWADLGAAGALEAKVLGDFASRGLPGPAYLYTQDPTEHLDNRKYLGSLVYRARLGDDWQLRASAAYSYSYTHYSDSSALYVKPLNDYYKQYIATISATIGYSPTTNLWLSLAEDLGCGHLNATIPDCPMPTRLSSTTSLSAKYSIAAFTVTASLTGSWMRDFVNTAHNSSAGSSTDASTGSTDGVGTTAPVALRRLSPSLCLSYTLPKGFLLRASIRESYRTPTFNDLYWTRIGNTSLKPEKALQTNLGLTYNFENSIFSANLTADAYCNYVRDKIVATPTLFVWRMRNIGKALIAGTDLSADFKWKIHSNISLFGSAGYSYIYAVNISDKTAKSYLNQLIYTPRHSGSATLSIDSKWLTISYLLTAVGERYFNDQNTASSRMAPYFDHGLSASRDFSFNISKSSGRDHSTNINKSSGRDHSTNVSKSSGRDHSTNVYKSASRPATGEPTTANGRVWHLGISAEALNLGGQNYEVVRSYPMPGRQFRIALKFTW